MQGEKGGAAEGQGHFTPRFHLATRIVGMVAAYGVAETSLSTNKERNKSINEILEEGNRAVCRGISFLKIPFQAPEWFRSP